MQFVVMAAVACVIVYLFVRRNRERAGNAPLREEIQARACFRTPLYRASVLGTGGFGGTRGMWIPLRGPKRLIVGTDAFMVSAPQALREYVFTGSDSSIALSQDPSRRTSLDWIVIIGQDGGRQVRLAITRENLAEVWQALAGTGVTLVPAPGELQPPGKSVLGQLTGRRRVAVFAFVVLSPFIPALVIFIAHHLR